LAKFQTSHNTNIRQEINGNGLKDVANFVTFSIFSFSHTDMLEWLRGCVAIMASVHPEQEIKNIYI
jgi:hypothetical protein